MTVKILLSVLLVYYVAVLWKYYRHDLTGILRKTEAEEASDGTGDEVEKPDNPDTIIGKSTYRKRQTYEPEANRSNAGNQADKTDNFAAGTPEIGSQKVMDETGNEPETATGNRAEQAEETTVPDDDTDYSDIEPEEDEPEEEEYVPTPEELEEEEELGAYYPDSNPDFATGYTFEDLKKVHKVITTDEADEEEKRQAREVLPAVMGSDVWEEMMDEFEGARQRVALLMNNSNV